MLTGAALALASLVVGGIVGLFAGALRLGGGVLIAPALFYSLAVVGPRDPHTVLATALAVIAVASAWSALWRRRRGDVAMQPTEAAAWAGGGLLGGAAAAATPDALLVAAMGAGAFAAALAMGVARFAPPSAPLWRDAPAAWVGIGAVATATGLGGAAAVALAAERRPRADPATLGRVAAVGALTAAPGAVALTTVAAVSSGGAGGYGGYGGGVDLIALAVVSPMILAVAPYGATVATLSPRWAVRTLFALVLALAGLGMLRA